MFVVSQKMKHLNKIICHFVKVYTSLKELIENHVQEALKQFLGESLDKLIFMKKMNECWMSHCQQMIMTRSIFLFLDRTYVLQHPTVMSIWDLGLDTFRRCVLTHQVNFSTTLFHLYHQSNLCKGF